MIKIKNLLITTLILNKTDVLSMHMSYNFTPNYNSQKEQKNTKENKNSGMNGQKNYNYDKKGVELELTNLSKQTQ